jgi:hypothetical protein
MRPTQNVGSYGFGCQPQPIIAISGSGLWVVLVVSAVSGRGRRSGAFRMGHRRGFANLNILCGMFWVLTCTDLGPSCVPQGIVLPLNWGGATTKVAEM